MPQNHLFLSAFLHGPVEYPLLENYWKRLLGSFVPQIVTSCPPPPLWQETSLPTSIGLNHVTCYGQWIISRSNRCTGLKLASGFCLGLLCSSDLLWDHALGIWGSINRNQDGAHLNPLTPWSQAAHNLRQNHSAEPHHQWPTCSKPWMIHVSLATGRWVVCPWPLCLLVFPDNKVKAVFSVTPRGRGKNWHYSCVNVF
jgi:hypothetical protein